ncbi:DnaJ C-terminal domain-containing protein [Halotalea alkalilenta]|uniref:DNA-binding protein n=1 Tax=Halotalea alkalilenta TaxID=376489 RepID=A0A172YE17_9GAMM|nr:DnaJ C-terminal domain-containing protein [Halotalea alkalilenta]ANF57205.1 DNA-binding protein [Halotalea alkalilenta]
MEFKDYYATLGVPEDADAKAIKSAYRKLARKYHPDVSREDDAEAKFKEVGEAYEVLGDAEKRAEYDQLRRYGNRAGEQFEPPPGWHGAGDGGFQAGETHFEGDFSDFFESLFGGRGQRRGGSHGFSAGGHGFERRAHRGQDVELELPLFLEEVVGGQPKQVRFTIAQHDAQGRREETEKSLNVRIPKGVVDGERIRLKGQGGAGVDGAENGDLYLKVRFAPHPRFDVDGHDLILTVPLAPWEAALGARVEVPTLTGRLQLTIPPNSQTGARLRIKGKGLPGRSTDGDLYALLKVVMPPRPAEGDEALWRGLAERHAGFHPRSQWS